MLHQNIPRTTVSQEEGSMWKYAGAAAYNNITFEFATCWLTTLPDENECMRCWLTFNEDTISTKAAESIIDYFLAVVAMISEHSDNAVDTLDDIPFDSETIERIEHDKPPLSSVPMVNPKQLRIWPRCTQNQASIWTYKIFMIFQFYERSVRFFWVIGSELKGNFRGWCLFRKRKCGGELNGRGLC